MDHWECWWRALLLPTFAQLSALSLASRFYLVSTLSGALLFPQYLVRKGTLDANDVSNFPPSLRRLMATSTWLAFVGMTWLCLVAGLLKLAKD